MGQINFKTLDLCQIWSCLLSWSNGLNKGHHASVAITIKEILEDRNVLLFDPVKAAWTHNTNVNKLGYSPLKLVTGKAVAVPGLTMYNVATEPI